MDKFNSRKLGIWESPHWYLIDRLERFRVLCQKNGGSTKSTLVSDHFQPHLGDIRRGRKKGVSEVGSADILLACVLAAMCILVIHITDQNAFQEDIQYYQTLAN